MRDTGLGWGVILRGKGCDMEESGVQGSRTGFGGGGVGTGTCRNLLPGRSTALAAMIRRQPRSAESATQSAAVSDVPPTSGPAVSSAVRADQQSRTQYHVVHEANINIT